MKTYKDPEVWKRGMEVAAAVYELTRNFPVEERFGLSQQMRRAAVSVVSNIAEGYGRRSPAQRHYFLEQSLGSSYELETQLELAARVGLGDEIQIGSVEKQLRNVITALPALMRYVKTDGWPVARR